MDSVLRGRLGSVQKLQALGPLDIADLKDLFAMKSHGREHKEKITAADALTIWRLVGCQLRGHELVAKDDFTVDEFLEVTNRVVERARRRNGEFYDRIFRMIDFHGRKKVSLADLKVFMRMCGRDYSDEVLQSLIHTIDSSGNDEYITRQDFIRWFEGLLAEEQDENQASGAAAGGNGGDTADRRR